MDDYWIYYSDKRSPKRAGPLYIAAARAEEEFQGRPVRWQFEQEGAHLRAVDDGQFLCLVGRKMYEVRDEDDNLCKRSLNLAGAIKFAEEQTHGGRWTADPDGLLFRKDSEDKDVYTILLGKEE